MMEQKVVNDIVNDEKSVQEEKAIVEEKVAEEKIVVEEAPVEEEKAVEEDALKEETVEEEKVEALTEEAVEDEVVQNVVTEDCPLTNKIEEKRLPLLDEYKKTRKLSNILTFVVLIMCIAGMYFVTNPDLAWLGWVLLGVGLAGMIAFYFLSKKKFDAHTKDYLDFVNESLNNETFNNPNFSNIENTNAKVETTDLDNNGAYCDIVRVASRNYINGQYKDINFKFAEIAIFKKDPATKRGPTAAFIGKYFDAENNLKFDGNIVINIARSEPVDSPNNVENRAKLYENNGMTVYGDEGFEFRNVVGDQFFGNLKKIEPIGHLLNLAISISEGHTKVFMSYDDDVIAIPFEKALNGDAFASFTEDLKNVFDVINLLGK